MTDQLHQLFAIIAISTIQATAPAAATPARPDPRHPAWLVGHCAEGSTAHCYQGQSKALLPNGIWTSSFSDSLGGTWSYAGGYLTFTTLFDGSEPNLKPTTSRTRIRWTREGYDSFITKAHGATQHYTSHQFRCGPPKADLTAMTALRPILHCRP